MTTGEPSLSGEAAGAVGFAGNQERTTGAAHARMVTGSIWMVMMRWSIRIIGMCSTLILVRVLAPKDFGILAIATMVTGMFEVFAETGQRLAIIRQRDVTPELLNSAFTVQVLICTGLAALTFLTAPFAQTYFHEPRAELVIQVLALRSLFMGFENIGTVAFRRDLDFAKEFQYGVYQKLANAILVVALAFILRNYWALALGIVIGTAGNVAISYLMHPYRPRFSLAKVKEIWSFSIWMLAGSVAIFAQSRVDQLALGGSVDAKALGKYAVGVDISTMPTAELVLPAGRALYPVFTRLAHKTEELKRAYLSSLAAFAVICWSTGVGVAVVSKDFTAIALGKQWTDIAPVVPWASLTMALFALGNTVLTVHQAVGYGRMFALGSWLRVILLLPILFVVAQHGNLVWVAEARFAATVLFTPLLFLSLRPVIGLTALDLWRINWRPATASAVMAAAVLGSNALLEGIPAIIRLFASAGVGAVVFAASEVAVWRLAGSPDGVERSSVNWLRARLGKFLPRPSAPAG